MSSDWRKSIFNGDDCGCSSSSTGSNGSTYETYALGTQQITFPFAPSEGFTTNYQVRGVPVSPSGQLAGIIFTKIGNVVHMIIPSFYGNLAQGNVTNIIRIISAGDMPDRFVPSYGLNYVIDARNNGGLIGVNQDSADLVMDSSGNVDLTSRSFLWNNNAGLSYDISVSWIVV